MTTDRAAQSGTKEPRGLNSTDIKWIAKGYWDRYFNYRFYAASKLPFALAMVFFIAMIAVAESTDSMLDAASGPATAMIVLGTATIIAVFAGIYTYARSRHEFINERSEMWDQGDRQLPDTKSVVDYIHRRK